VVAHCFFAEKWICKNSELIEDLKIQRARRRTSKNLGRKGRKGRTQRAQRKKANGPISIGRKGELITNVELRELQITNYGISTHVFVMFCRAKKK
jgi:hypothetical protein